MKRFFYAVSLVVLIACEASVAGGDITFQVSKYPDKVRVLDSLAAGMPLKRSAALKKIVAELGESFSDDSGVRLVFTDALTKDFGKYKKYHAIRLSRGDEQVIVFFVEYYFAGQYDMQKKITHELTHAVIRKKMSATDYICIPNWIREGVAMHIAGQGEARLKMLCANSFENLGSMVKGLENTTDRFEEYGEFYLAIKYMSEKFGRDSIGKLIRELVRLRGDYRTAIEGVLGVSWDRFRRGAAKYSRREIKDLTDQLVYKWKLAFRAFLEKDYAGAEKKIKKILDEYPDSWIHGKALFYYAYSLQQQKKYREAIRAYDEMAASYPMSCNLVHHARREKGVCEYILKLHIAAINTLRDYLRDYESVDPGPRALYYLGASYIAIGRQEDGAKYLKSILKNNPDSKYSLEAEKLLEGLDSRRRKN